jgi:hypothetical protein
MSKSGEDLIPQVAIYRVSFAAGSSGNLKR